MKSLDAQGLALANGQHQISFLENTSINGFGRAHTVDLTGGAAEMDPDFRYMVEKLSGLGKKIIARFNPVAAGNVMCRNTVSVGWDGFLYDCDFNQMLDLTVNTSHFHINDFEMEVLQARNIVTNKHCFGCTAGAGSSCGGVTS